VHNLSTLSDTMNNWSCAVIDYKNDATNDMKQGVEQLMQAEHRGKGAENRFADDQDLLERANATLAETIGRCKEADIQAHHTLAESRKALSSARGAQEHWTRELEKARAWLERALQRLSRARAELQRAQAKLSYAINTLNGAERALRSCMNDDNRSNCRGEEAAVQRARAMVHAAQQEMQVAEREVRAAEEESTRARSRVTACTTALNLAKESVKVATSAVEAAQQAVDYAGRSLENAEAARKALIETQSALSTEEEAITAMQAVLKEGQTQVAEAQQHEKNADYYETSAQNIYHRAKSDLENHIKHLHNLDRPDLADKLKIVIPAAIAGIIFGVNAYTVQPPTFAPRYYENIQKVGEFRDEIETLDEGTLDALDEQEKNMNLFRKNSDPPGQ
jgi:chromosome segregation ATPase